VTGSNGAGKTTLLRTLAGLMYAEEGRIRWHGGDVREDLAAYHADLAYIGHEPPLKSDLTPAENLLYWVGVRRTLRHAELEAALDRVAADESWRDRPIRTLSAGQKRRVALAGLALMAAPLWLLDEPTTNLDAQGQHLVGSLIEAHLHAGGLAIAAIHHDLNLSTSGVRRFELVSE